MSSSRQRHGIRRTGPWPLTALAKDYTAATHVAPHRHHRGQVLYAESGLTRVMTRDGVWIVPPQRALWIPPETVHEATAESDVALRTLYLDAATSARFGGRCKAVAVSSLLRELILEAVRAYRGRNRTRLRILSPVLIHELLAASEAGLCIPMPSDPRLARVCHRLLGDAARGDTIEGLASFAGASSRTLARLFEGELGMTFVRWRQHVHLARALSQLAAGVPVKKAAGDAGYASCSAFSAMFRRVLGAPPTRYLRQRTHLAGPETVRN